MPFRVLWVSRFAQLFGGLALYGIGIALMVRGAIGVAPWDVFAQGVALATGLDFGLIIVLTGVSILVLWIPLREPFGIGTVLTALLIGPVAQILLNSFAEPESLLLRILLFALGLITVALATGLYIGAHYGAGPRDGLMTGIHARTGWPIWLVRSVIEVAALTIGWILGGNVGIGTVLFALLIGPLVQKPLQWFDARKRLVRRRLRFSFRPLPRR